MDENYILEMLIVRRYWVLLWITLYLIHEDTCDCRTGTSH